VYLCVLKLSEHIISNDAISAFADYNLTMVTCNKIRAEVKLFCS